MIFTGDDISIIAVDHCVLEKNMRETLHGHYVNTLCLELLISGENFNLNSIFKVDRSILALRSLKVVYDT